MHGACGVKVKIPEVQILKSNQAFLDSSASAASRRSCEELVSPAP